jgi:L-fucose mutarotase/ribose pyranase (RbsD/FucU family)
VQLTRAVHALDPDQLDVTGGRGTRDERVRTGRGTASRRRGRRPLQPLGRLDFYATCLEPDLAVCVATGDDRLYANILLTVGFLTPSS